ncbi:hypothetical protein FFH90_011620 [Pseudomonas sp. ATCC 43928]|nr:hypothetical protein C1X68_01895 [Pseudomonas sp. FW303-C2]PMY93232.1 hypothetical protein C1X67_08905 [Pseudomonas sp. FW305-62]PNA81743.1 hypothetical protein C1X66_27915 [Pseudomonas sp. MPR-R3B]PNB19396.1 hypothetical protein C1X69_17775 [Pseudomonas sp. FW305-67]QDV94906.1 hypothetical protein FFH90_011620 [Pseudomonas sp. ATCC 43928]
MSGTHVGRGAGLSGTHVGRGAGLSSDHVGRGAGLSGTHVGRGAGLSSDHAGKAVRDRGVNGNHFGSERNSDRGHGAVTSGIAHSRDTRGVAKASAISATTPGDHNTKGLSSARTSISKRLD